LLPHLFTISVICFTACPKILPYLGRLSPSSIRSLELQGAPYGESEVREFESNGCFREAVALRRWDDMAKIPDLELPGLKTFRELLERES
jgi:[1-hydroxy-2-(trimethylamino)ethyl]phosphonate dioxygenase